MLPILAAFKRGLEEDVVDSDLIRRCNSNVRDNPETIDACSTPVSEPLSDLFRESGIGDDGKGTS
jgi:hypothetical protein